MINRTGDILQDYNCPVQETALETVNNDISEIRHSTMHTNRMRNIKTEENQSKQ